MKPARVERGGQIAGQWWVAYPASPPPGLSDSSAVYDPGLSGILVFGGLNASGNYSGASWLYSDGAWTALSTPPSLAARANSAIGLDGTGTTPVLTGGTNDTQTFSDTWVYEVPPSAGASENLSVAELGESVEFTLQLNGGTAPYSVNVNFGDGSVDTLSTTGSLLTIDHGFGYAGMFNVTWNVTDGVGAWASVNSLALSVTGGPVVQAQVASSAGDVGIPLAFGPSIVSPGTPPLTFAWQFGDGTNGSGPNVTHAFAAPGSYQVFLNATDGLGVTSTSTVMVAISSDLAASITTLPGPTAGSPEGFGAGSTGGTAPFTYAWRFGDGSTSSAASPEHVYAQAGTYAVEVWVNDSVGGSAHATASLVVAAGSGSSSSGSSSPVPTWFWAGLAGLGVVVVVGVVLLTRRKP